LPPAKSKGTQWVRENRAAVEAWNKHVEETG
jgi:post-segregation antitoxin (ccd killing protein)